MMRTKTGLYLISGAVAATLIAFGCRTASTPTAGVKDIAATDGGPAGAGESSISYFSDGGEVRRVNCAAGATDARACPVTHKMAEAAFKDALGKAYMAVSKLKTLSAAQAEVLDLIMKDLADPKSKGLASVTDVFKAQDYSYFVGLFDIALGAAKAGADGQPTSAQEALAGNAAQALGAGTYSLTVVRAPGFALGAPAQIVPAATGHCIQFNFVNCSGMQVLQANVAGPEGGLLLPTGGANNPATGLFCSINAQKTFAWVSVVVQNSTQFVQTCQLNFQIVNDGGGQGGDGGQGGFTQNGQNGFNQGGFNQGGQSQGGFNQGGFNQGGFNQGGFAQGGGTQNGGQPGGVGAQCNYAIFPPQACQTGLACITSGIPGAPGTCQQGNSQGGFNQGGQGGFNQGGQGGFNQGGGQGGGGLSGAVCGDASQNTRACINAQRNIVTIIGKVNNIQAQYQVQQAQPSTLYPGATAYYGVANLSFIQGMTPLQQVSFLIHPNGTAKLVYMTTQGWATFGNNPNPFSLFPQ